MIPEELSYLSDIHSIEQVLYRYAIAIDSKEIDLLDSCFCSEADFHMVGTGVFSITEYKDLCRSVLPALDATQHLVARPVITVEGGSASTRSYFIAQHARNSLSPRPFLMIGGWYDDEFLKTSDGWRIGKRTGVSVWYDGNPEVLGGSEALGGGRWCENRKCPDWLSSKFL